MSHKDLIISFLCRSTKRYTILKSGFTGKSRFNSSVILSILFCTNRDVRLMYIIHTINNGYYSRCKRK